MDAVTFLREHKRLCAAQSCVACPVYATGQGCTEDDNPELVVATVEEWSAAHPRKTRQSVFLEQWPNARVADGFPGCPQNVEGMYHPPCGCASVSCYQCRREFWMQEVE